MKNIKYLLAFLLMFSICGCKKEESETPLQNPDQFTNVNGNAIQQKYLTNIKTIKEKSSSLSIPPFVLKITGLKDKTINSNSLSNLKMYDVISYRTKNYYESTEDYIEVRTSGIRLVDVIDYLGIDEYSEITFIDQEDGEIKLPAAKIDKEVYLTFYESGVLIGDNKINLVIPAYVNIFWAEGIKEISITR